MTATYYANTTGNSPLAVNWPTYEARRYFGDGTECPLGRMHVTEMRITASVPFELTECCGVEGPVEPCPCNSRKDGAA